MKTRIIAALAAAIALSACSQQDLAKLTSFAAPSAAVAKAVVPPEQLAQLADACRTGSAVLSVNSVRERVPAVVYETAVPADAFCRQLLAGTVPPTADRNSLPWLMDILGRALPTALSVARAVRR